MTQDATKLKVLRGAAANSESVEPPQMANVYGSRLLNLLVSTMQERDETRADAAKAIKMSYPYFCSLLNGNRKPHEIQRQHLVGLAKYLRLPVAQVYILAGALQISDFFHPGQVKQEAEGIYESMLSHPDWASLCPDRTTWDNMPFETKMLICTMYERLTGHRFMTIPEVMQPK